jgi:serine phosphatase RsbU (regulator of sigma subunit)
VLVQRTRGGAIETLDPPGPPLGILREFMGDRVEPIQLSPGGTLLVMSDGIFEAFAPDKAQFGVETVEAIIKQNPDHSPEQFLETIRSAVQRWQGKIEPVDDQTLVIAQMDR